jgi:1-pyrroline-5-carboxylate dehydrogenase
MFDAVVSPPAPINEPILSYAPGSPERAELKAELARMAGAAIEIPMCIGGEQVETKQRSEVRAPHRRAQVLGHAHVGDASHVERAIEAARRAHGPWAALPWTARAAVFLKAAELLATTWRPRLNAATMLGQSKTAYQAEIDAACELVDFLRFNVHYARQIAEQQPQSARGMWNAVEPRPLEGFVFAASPFNFTAIGGNLPSAPALMGNTVVWKPSANAMLSAHWVMQLFRASGLPDGVINLVNGDPEGVANACLDHPDLAGVHFTGSTGVFQAMWKRVGNNMGRYKTYPRLVGETGGKDFVFAHRSAEVDALAVALVRGAFEYQGQKCSAASRAYIPASLWPRLRARVVELVAEIKMGDVTDFRNFMGAVIDEKAFRRLDERLGAAKGDSQCKVLTGGAADSKEGWFVQPSVIEVGDPKHRLMQDELFGPVLAVWVYQDGEEDAALRLCDETSPYALTGAVFANDRHFVERAGQALRFAAGNFYINDKPTGAVVGQQPFGGARASGTNDKAGSMLNLLRWVSPRVVKETFAPPAELGYPFMREA